MSKSACERARVCVRPWRMSCRVIKPAPCTGMGCWGAEGWGLQGSTAVSYTHLTLPTICSV
eukprot:4442319-Alexandrium_andersonii.AAC.1